MKLFSQPADSGMAENTAEVTPGYEQQLTREIPQLRRFIRSQVNNPHDAEDLLQDTLVRSLQSPSRQQVQSPLAYGLQVARSVIFDFWRKDKRQPEAMAELPEAATMALDDEHMARQKLDCVSQVLQQMPALRRQVFLMRRLEGKSREAIAAELGLADESVKKHITRAMVDLARAVERHERGL
ncbi:RNA polymerase sigma factor [Oceanobacter mangrovi]|uniref:RNA polymerase sigma factor n=1 Tax=Oceanobacter mangrovi TaxID=2862510 RepID=UPI001C8E380C|nr:RNA polymerase sigma factor [Oceanobacter mangrovi]